LKKYGIWALALAIGLGQVPFWFLAAPEIEWRWLVWRYELTDYRFGNGLVVNHVRALRSTPWHWEDSMTIYTQPAIADNPDLIRQDFTTDVYAVFWATVPWHPERGSRPFVCISGTMADGWQELTVQFARIPGSDMKQPLSIEYKFQEKGGMFIEEYGSCGHEWGDLSALSEDGLPPIQGRPMPYGHIQLWDHGRKETVPKSEAQPL